VIRALVVRVVAAPWGPCIEHIGTDLESMQKIVGGYVERIPMNNGLELWCNEEGLMLDLPFNRTVAGHHIHGDFFITRNAGDSSIDLTDADLALLNPAELEDEDVCSTCEGTGRNAEGDDICQDCFK